MKLSSASGNSTTTSSSMNKIAIWGYQDFSAGVITSVNVTLTANQNGISAPFVASDILNESAFIVRANNLTKYVYTGTVGLFSNTVQVSSISGTSVTLSAVPHSSYQIRIYYLIKSEEFPVGYTPPPAIVSAKHITNLDSILANQTEFDNHSNSTSNPHSVTKTQIGLSNVPNTDATQRANHTGTQTASTISDFDNEVSNNASVVANTNKISADGSVTTHNDVTNAGSGAIITAAERTKLSGIETGAKDDQIASEIPFTANGDITSTNVQAAIQEVRDDTDTKLSNISSAVSEVYSGNLQGGSTTTLTLSTNVKALEILYVSDNAGLVNRQIIYRIYKTGTVDKGYGEGSGTGYDSTYLDEIVFSFASITWSSGLFDHERTGYTTFSNRSENARNSNNSYVIKKIYQIV